MSSPKGPHENYTAGPRTLHHEDLTSDLVVVGGGLSGLCCALTAAREGLRVTLVQDRPVLGGNASSEVRLWVLGATSHMGNNNRWAREGGIIDEILVENLWRNPEGNAIVFDSILLDFATREARLQLLLNTAVDSITQQPDGAIATASAFCSQNQKRYTLRAPLFVDASGDGILGFLSGAAFRMGAEGRQEFGEGMAPEHEQSTLLGHSLYFYTRDTSRPVRFIPPSFSLRDITTIPRFREIRAADDGCRLWWLEYGGDRDTVLETEEIKWELWRVAYGVWNHIKNSGLFPEAETLTLEWMGTIPGKRESRRFEGDLILTQQDIVEQRSHADAVSFGGWAIDLHPSDGVYSAKPGCEQWHSKGVYQIPFRTMYSRNVPNLLLTGRLISATHIAFGSTRVMATCAHNGQAVGMAAALCTEQQLRPRDLLRKDCMHSLQQRLLRSGQWIPGLVADDCADLAKQASVRASSTLELASLSPSGEWAPLDTPMALLLPLAAGPVPTVTFTLQASKAAEVRFELWSSSVEGNATPDVQLATHNISLAPGHHNAPVSFNVSLDTPQHVFVVLQTVEGVSVALSQQQITGVLTLLQKMNKAVAKSLVQTPPEGSGMDTFAFWLPERRPAARNLAVMIDPPLSAFAPANAMNGIARPWLGVNAWLPAPGDPRPTLTLTWPKPVRLSRIELSFDTDFDHPMESVLMGHPETVMPACVQAFQLCSEGRELAHVEHNHQTRWSITLPEPHTTSCLDLHVLAHGPALPAIFEVRCY